MVRKTLQYGMRAGDGFFYNVLLYCMFYITINVYCSLSNVLQTITLHNATHCAARDVLYNLYNLLQSGVLYNPRSISSLRFLPPCTVCTLTCTQPLFLPAFRGPKLKI